MEILKPQNRSTDEIIRYLLETKKQIAEESKTFVKTEEFQVIRKKLKELNKKMNYKFYFEGGQNNSYFFETAEGIIYEIIFKFTPYLFELKNVDIIENTFEFSILLNYNPDSKTPSNDKKIGATVVAIFMDFYLKRNKAVSVYICDSADGKELIRKRKFDQWFLKYNDDTFVKVDEMLIDKQNNKFPISLIIAKTNPYRAEIFEAFVQMSMNNKK